MINSQFDSLTLKFCQLRLKVLGLVNEPKEQLKVEEVDDNINDESKQNEDENVEEIQLQDNADEEQIDTTNNDNEKKNTPDSEMNSSKQDVDTSLGESGAISSDNAQSLQLFVMGHEYKENIQVC